MITILTALLAAQDFSDPRTRDEVAKTWAEKDLSVDAKLQRVRVYFHSAN